MDEDEDEDGWRERLARAHDTHVRTGSDPRWRRLGDSTEMGVLSGIGWANYWAALGVTPKLVPPEFWALDVRDTGTIEINDSSGRDLPVIVPVAVVACPCGHEPQATKLAMPVECRAQRPSTCPRYFFFDGENVYAFNSPKPPASAAI